MARTSSNLRAWLMRVFGRQSTPSREVSQQVSSQPVASNAPNIEEVLESERSTEATGADAQPLPGDVQDELEAINRQDTSRRARDHE